LAMSGSAESEEARVQPRCKRRKRARASSC
jgi:hypothetical protein